MRFLFLPVLLSLGLGLAHVSAVAQQVGVGGFFALSDQSASQGSQYSNSTVIASVGIYAEWLRPRIHPGLELRDVATDTGVSGGLVGPRASMSLGHFHPYAAILFGANHAPLASPAITYDPGQTAPNLDRQGITTQGTIGLDIDVKPAVRYRILEFSQLNFTGIPNSRPYEITTGFVVHFK